MNLTDYTLPELRVIQAVTKEAMEACKAYIAIVDKKVIASPEFMRDLKIKENHRMEILSNFLDHLETSIELVEEKLEAETEDPERFKY